METRSILVGLILGFIIGGFVGFVAVPSPDISELQSQISELETEVSARTGALSELSSKYDQLQDDHQSLQSELEMVVKNLQDRIEECEALQGELDARDSRIQELESTIEDLEDTIERLQLVFNCTLGKWSVLNTWNGSADRTTELFYVPSNQTKITWSLDVGQYAYFSIRIRNEKGESVDSWLSLEQQPEGETYAYVDPENYYLEFSVLNCSYTVTIEAEIS